MAALHRTSEAQIGEAVLRILAMSPNGEATMSNLKQRLPHFVSLTESDRTLSETRCGEERWEQLLRNLVSHYKTKGNIIGDGLVVQCNRGRLRITAMGRERAKEDTAANL
jgi:hypothetical protein